MLTALLLLTPTPDLALANQLAIDGYHLTMTIEKAKQINPNVTFTEIRPRSDGTIIGVKGESKGLQLFFTPRKRGGKLMRVEKQTVFDSEPDLETVMNNLIATYGRPDQAGRDMINYHACWGACPGVGPKLLFRLKTFFPVKVDHRMTLILFDPGMEKENKKAYRNTD
jgi:hypothetical protein